MFAFRPVQNGVAFSMFSTDLEPNPYSVLKPSINLGFMACISFGTCCTDHEKLGGRNQDVFS